MRIDGCTALITGASAGIGREFARQLGGRVATLVLVARRQARLEELRAELIERHPQLRVEIRPTDLSQQRAGRRTDCLGGQQKPAIDLLINNAGLGDMGAFSTADPERVDQMMQVNMVALTRLTRALLPAHDRTKARRDFECQFLGQLSPDPEFRGLRGDQSVRDQLYRSLARRAARNRDSPLGPLSRAGADGVHRGGAAPADRTCCRASRSWLTCRSRRSSGRPCMESSTTGRSSFQAW